MRSPCLTRRLRDGAAVFLLALGGLPASALDGGLEVGQLQLQSCLLDGPNGGLAAYCTRLQAPLYHEDPERGSIELALAWLPARAQRPAADPIVFLAGGPGQSARETWPRLDAALSALRATRAVLLLDQRGTGASTPLHCEMGELEQLDTAPDPALMRQLAADCLAAQSVDPAPFTTEDAVADLDYVRQRLGIEQLNLIGGSYGTRVGQRYARRHPQHVRSLLLDGVVPETLALGSEHGRNLDAALAGQFALCQADAACAEAFGDPLALLGRLRAQLAEEGAISVAVRHPRTMQNEQIDFGTPILAGAMRLGAYTPETSALLPFSLSEALAGRPQGLIGQAWLAADSLGQSLAIGVNYSVACNEDLPAFDEAMLAAEADTLLGAEMMEGLRIQCEQWPRREVPADRFEPLSADLPVLLLSGEFDPVTPPRYGEAVLQQLPRGRHLVAPGQGHIVLTRGCMPRLVAAFIDGADAQALEADCLERLQAPPYFLNYNGAQP